jgi:hypothetical protein
MRHYLAGLVALCTLAIAAFSQVSGSPFLGRWDFDVKTTGSVGANWLGVTQKGDALQVWFQPTGGHVYEVKDAKVAGTHLTFTASPAAGKHPATTWELDASDGKLTGVEKQGEQSTPLTGVRAPTLKRKASTARISTAGNLSAMPQKVIGWCRTACL